MRLLIFDLDGTLIDSKMDLVHAVNATRAHMHLPALDVLTVSSYVGNGAPVLIRRALGPDAPEREVEHALQFFLDYYRNHMLDCTTLYPGVRETLAHLHGEQRTLAVLTNKPVRISKAILEGLGVGSLFFQIYGGNSFASKKPDPVGVEALLGETGFSPAEALMVGDSAVDVQTARNAGIRSCGVTYGFQPESLETTQPDYIIERMTDILTLLREVS